MVGSAFQKPKFTLERVEGKVNLDKYDKSNYSECVLRIGGKKFNYDADVADVMMQGAVYAVYISKQDNNDDILSVELISKAK